MAAVLVPFVLLGLNEIRSHDLRTRLQALFRHQQRQGTLLIRGARIFVGDGRVVESGAVLVRAGRIAEIYEGAGPDPTSSARSSSKSFRRRYSPRRARSSRKARRPTPDDRLAFGNCSASRARTCCARTRPATGDAARLLRSESRIGLIAKDHDADLLIVDGNPLTDISMTERISLVVFKGERIRRAALFEEIDRYGLTRESQAS